MAIRLKHEDTEEFGGVTFAEDVLARYDIIVYDLDGWAYDWDEVPYARSALELVRTELPPERAKLLDAADAFWRAHPAEFNAFSKYHHARVSLDTAMANWVRNDTGPIPPVPSSHWWWKPL